MIQNSIRPICLSAMRAFVAFICIDLLLEYLAIKLFGVSAKVEFEHADFGGSFLFVNGILLYGKMVIVMSLYSALEKKYTSKNGVLVFTIGLFLLYGILSKMQLVNFGVLSIRHFYLYLVFTVIESPIAIFIGVWSYHDK